MIAAINPGNLEKSPLAGAKRLVIPRQMRGRGIGTEALSALSKQLATNGLKAFHLEVDRDDTRAQGFYQKLGYELRDRYALMSRYF